jgi:hypothetical protein
MRFVDPTGEDPTDPEERRNAHMRIQKELIKWVKNLFTINMDPQNPYKSIEEQKQKNETIGQITEGVNTLGDILSFFTPFSSVIEFGAKASIEDYEGALALVPWMLIDAATAGEGNLLTQWGWKGSKIWKNLVKEVGKGGTFEKLGGKIATKSEAIQLLKDAGVDMSKIRIEKAHDFPNPHSYNHINYYTSSGIKGTIKTQ